MATTSPDNIRTPNSGDQYALVQDLGVLADTVQDAFIKRANSYMGTVAQRNAFNDAPVGTIWSDTDGERLVWKRGATEWEAVSPVETDTGWNNLPLSSGSGTLRWRAIGEDVEIYWNQSRDLPTGNTQLSSQALPVSYRPSSTVRGYAAMNGNPSAGVYITSSGLVSALNATGSTRTGGEGTIRYMLP